MVTGSAISGGVKKLEASYNIVTANEDEIRNANPKSTADLLKISPGMWPESTGGQTGANIEIAGFPGGGDAPYFTTQMMGSPLYGMPTLSFFETTSIFRLDDTIRSVEILQGGPSVVFAGGQIGATANYLLKTGSEEPSGSLGLTYGDENLMRVDGFYGFKISEGWYGSVGGFYRVSDGVRDPQFNADEGGQLTATLKRESDKGDLVLYARYLDDKNQFITPIPLIQRGTDQFSAFPGFDPLDATYYSKAIQHVRLDGYPNGGTNADLANGRGAQMIFLGANYDYEFDNGWSISDKFLFNSGDVDTNALFSGSNPATLNEALYTNPTNLGGLGLPLNSATATFVGGGAVAADQSVIHQGWWFIHKELEHFNNDLRLSKELFEGNTLTIGLYTAYYTMDDEWALGNEMLMTNTPNARPITVSFVQGGLTFQRTDEQGFLDNGGFHIAQAGHAFNMALYLSDSWRIDKWLLDASVRYENQEATNRVCHLTNVNIDDNPLTLYNNSVPVCDGTLDITDYDEDFTSWTVGANYSFTDSMAAYGRVNRGGHFADFDNGIRGSTTDNIDPLQEIRNYEVGFKFENDLVYADISTYYRDFTGLSYQQTTSNGAPTGESAVLWLRVDGHQLHRLDQPARQLPLPGDCQLSRRRVHGLRRVLPVHQRRDGQRVRADRRSAIAAPAQAALHADAELHVRAAVGRCRGVRQLHARRRSHPGSGGTAAAGHIRDLGLRHRRERRRELAVQLARHERDRRAGPHGSQLAHLRRGGRRRRRDPGPPARGQRDQLPGQVPVVAVCGSRLPSCS